MGLEVFKPGVKDKFFPWIMHTVKTKPEMYPLWACFIVAGGLIGYFGTWSMLKPDVWLNRANKTPPWHWSRAKALYDKRQKVFFDSPNNWKRIPENEDLQEKMQAASMARHGKGYNYLF